MRVLLFLGTRPEAIKLAPVALALRDHPDLEPIVVDTGQHVELSAGMLELFGVAVDHRMRTMQAGQGLSNLFAKVIAGADEVLAEKEPDLVVVQGDTTTVAAAALAAFHRRIPVAHVEAGLRSGSLTQPFPEEANRRLTSVLTALHFPPTQRAADALLAEHVPAERVLVTGNTVIDALQLERSRQQDPAVAAALDAELSEILGAGWRDSPFVLVTGHRRESFGEGFENVCTALRQLAEQHPDHRVVYAVHLNPRVQEPVRRILGDASNVQLIDPQGYAPFIRLLDTCRLIVTDSGGVQEEGPSFGKPVLVTRERTERPEGVEAGCSMLVGTDGDKLLSRASELLSDTAAYDAVARVDNPYGDGKASERIARACAAFLSA